MPCSAKQLGKERHLFGLLQQPVCGFSGQDRLEAEAERQQQQHQNSSDMQTSMSGEEASMDAANARQTSKDGVLQQQCR